MTRGWEEERKCGRLKCLRELKKHYSFSNRFRNSKYSNICTSPSLCSSLRCPQVLFDSLRASRAGKLRDSGREMKGEGWESEAESQRAAFIDKVKSGFRAHGGTSWRAFFLGGGCYFVTTYLFRFQLDCSPLAPLCYSNLVNQDTPPQKTHTHTHTHSSSIPREYIIRSSLFLQPCSSLLITG